MRTKWCCVVAVIGALAGPLGCVTTKVYVDPTLPKVTLGDIAVPLNPRPVALVVHFQRNGEAMEAVTPSVAKRVIASLETSRVFSRVSLGEDASVDRIALTMNNVADLAGARAKGFKTGLSFGAAGSVVVDNYEFKVSFIRAGDRAIEKTYSHAIQTAIGNAKVEGLEPMSSPDAALSQVIEDVTLTFLRDLEQNGALGRMRAPDA